jgi:hypothetical protein
MMILHQLTIAVDTGFRSASAWPFVGEILRYLDFTAISDRRAVITSVTRADGVANPRKGASVRVQLSLEPLNNTGKIRAMRFSGHA